MGQLTEYEIKVLTLIAETIGCKIFAIEDGAKEKDKLAYSTCLDDNEKTKYTQQAIKKLQVSFKKCVPDVASYITAFININPSDNSSYDERKDTIIRNFFLEVYSEVLDLLVELKPRDIEDAITIDVEHYIHYLGLNTIALEDFIQQFANAERYVGLVSILEKLNDEAPIILASLEAKISELQKMTDEFIPQVISTKLTPLLNSSNELSVIDLSIRKVTNEYYKVFDAVRCEILNALDRLKNISKNEYLKGISQTYDNIIKLVYDDRYFANNSIDDEYLKRQNDPSYYCYLSVYKVLHNSIFKGITDELLINRLIDFDSAFNLPSSYNDTIEYINKGFYELESMMEGKIIKMKYFNIPRAIEKFNSLRNKYENKPKESLSLLEKYFDISQQIYNQIDQGEFENTDAFEDETFMKVWNELCFFYDNMQGLFSKAEIDYLTPVGVTKVLDILNPLNIPTAEPVQVIKTKNETSIHIAFTYSKKLPKDKNNLTEFRKSLIEGGFIDKSTKLTDFNKVFKNERITVPIIWTGNLSELYYLIKTLHNDKKLIDNTGKEVWKITANCFVDIANTPYDFKKFRGQKTPASSKKLDRIISVL